MALVLQLQDLTFRYDTQLEPLFRGVDLSLYSGDKAALLGHNGAGKTTLLNLLAGELSPGEGEVSYRGSLALVRQEDRLGGSGTVLEALLALNPDLSTLHLEIKKLEANGVGDGLHYADLITAFAAAGGFNHLQQLEAEVSALGFPEDALARPASSLSGGERRLLKLMSAFLQETDLLVLDEPTNYLDERATTYLIEKITAFAGACLVVSHDRWFLDQTVARVLELEHRALHSYSGNYSVFRATKDAHFRQQVRRKEKLETEIGKLQEIERTYKVWGARKEKEKKGAADKGFIGARAAKLRKRAILAKERRQQRIEDLRTEKPWVDKKYAVAFEAVATPSGTCLAVRDLSYRYGDDCVLEGVSFTLAWAERVALRGQNGAGKSTLIKLLLGELAPARGEVLWAKGVSVGYLPQLWQAPNATTPAELFSDEQAQKARTLLGALRVKGDSFYQPLADLSEGQKRKVRLVQLILERPNVLILDEPTTHLDYESVEMLENALADYTGTLILVSHDTYLRERVCKRELVVEKLGRG